jgi:hypothetical protein
VSLLFLQNGDLGVTQQDYLLGWQQQRLSRHAAVLFPTGTGSTAEPEQQVMQWLVQRALKQRLNELRAMAQVRENKQAAALFLFNARKAAAGSAMPLQCIAAAVEQHTPASELPGRAAQIAQQLADAAAAAAGGVAPDAYRALLQQLLAKLLNKSCISTDQRKAVTDALVAAAAQMAREGISLPVLYLQDPKKASWLALQAVVVAI